MHSFLGLGEKRGRSLQLTSGFGSEVQRTYCPRETSWGNSVRTRLLLKGASEKMRFPTPGIH